jgi:hypothetical protein
MIGTTSSGISDQLRDINSIRNVHYIAKYNKPFREYGQLCKLDQAKGLDVGTVYYGQSSSI